MKLFLIVLVAFFSFQSFSKTAYVHLMKAFENTKQGRKVKTRLEKTANKAKAEFKSKELRLQKEEESLKKEMALLTEQARAQKISQLQQKIVNFQKEAKNKDTELQNLQNKLMNPILERLKKVIAEVAKKQSYAMVKNVGTEVLWVSPELDLTTQVYKAYNKRYK
ncbi:MAG: OmpH family outer membrane protein [Oligoflexia bacterium]|nr:OmpH family outer membrane protein [Oligoflexia bacterium]